MLKLTLDDLHLLVGYHGPFSTKVINLFSTFNFHFRIPQQEELEIIHKEISEIINKDTKVAGEHRLQAWEDGWAKNLEEFKRTGKFESLNPGYYRPGKPIRLYGGYIIPEDPYFELNLYKVFATWLFTEYLKTDTTVYEFGCGSCHNLAMIANLFPHKEIIGLDWSEASVNIANQIGYAGYNVSGRLFNFFKMDDFKFRLKPNSTVFTIGGLEQIGSAHQPFIDYLIRNKPRAVIHIEPIVEWYDVEEGSPSALLGYAFHMKRNYLSGLTDLLRKYQKEGRIEILKEHKAPNGGQFIDGHSQIVWRPL